MIARAQTWQSYGALLRRLLPDLDHVLIAGADGSMWWESGPQSAALLQPTLSILLRSATNRENALDGLADTHAGAARACGFRIRGALGEILGVVLLAVRAEIEQPPDLAQVHALVKPALDCMQSELMARAAIGELRADLADNSRNLDLYHRLSEAGVADGADALAQMPALALEHLSGIAAAILLPERRYAAWRPAPGRPQRIDADALAQLNRHLLTRARLHGCTLVANNLALDGLGAALPYKAISTPILDEHRRVIGLLAVFRMDTDTDFQLNDAEVMELLARKAGMITRTSFDFATGLPTQAAFVAQANRRLAATQDRAPSYGLLYVDIDQLNVVNENHGMPVGDEVIQSVAALLSAKTRAGASAARIAGDRFAMLVPGGGIEPAARIAEELRAAAVKLSCAHGDKPVLVSLSIGVARVGGDERRVEPALAAAELACHAAKQRGRNRVDFHSDVGGASARRPAAGAVNLLAHALAAESLELLAQAVLPLGAAPADPRFEILLRARAPDGARLSYEKLVLADGGPESARGIDAWVTEQVLARLAGCRELLRRHPASFSVNLSAASLDHAEFWRMLESGVRAARIEPGTLSFEFPESAASDQVGRIAQRMAGLRDQGVWFALDHFGRERSSLANLDMLPVSCVKIDGSYSRNLVHDPRSQSMVIAIAKLARGFGLETVATNVETDAIRDKAAKFGVDFGQGFLIGKPVPFDEALRDLPLYACFSTSTGLFDFGPGQGAVLNG